MHNSTQYRRLTGVEREEVNRDLARGETLSAIARRLGRTPSTIAREVNRNSGIDGYRAFSAERCAMERASSCRNGKSRLTHEERLHIYVIEKLRKHWSPREIKRVQRELNDRPRAVLHYKKPDEVTN